MPGGSTCSPPGHHPSQTFAGRSHSLGLIARLCIMLQGNVRNAISRKVGSRSGHRRLET
jgi:hypothetical protein